MSTDTDNTAARVAKQRELIARLEAKGGSLTDAEQRRLDDAKGRLAAFNAFTKKRRREGST